MRTKIALIGANGQLGSDLTKVLSKDPSFSLFPLTHKDIEITKDEMINQVLSSIKPSIVINTSAYHKVDEVEVNPEKAFLVNSIAVKNLAQYCQGKKNLLVHISTDYVFGLDDRRTKPYTEDDIPAPINTYGITKLAGENFIKYTCPQHLIIRTSGLFGTAGSSGKGGNFVETMLKLARKKKEVRVVNDQTLSPTYTLRLAEQISALIKKTCQGLFHATSEGYCSWYEFAREIFKLTNTECILKPVTSDQFSTIARRPKFSVLENYRLKEVGINLIPSWQECLKAYLKEKSYI